MRRTLLIALLLSAGVPVALAGEWKYVACSPGAEASPNSFQRTPWAPHAEGDGTVNAHARVTTFQRGGLTIAAAIDATRADATLPDVLRLDFTGKRTFANAATVPLKLTSKSADDYLLEIAPVQLQVPRDGQKIPVEVRGRYYKFSSGRESVRMLSVAMHCALQGRCRFGANSYPVRLFDATGNLTVGEKPDRVKAGGGFMMTTGGDHVLIDTGDGTFTGEGVIRAYCGQPVWVDEALYDIVVAKDGLSATARASTVETAAIALPHRNWKMELLGEKHILMLTGSTDPVVVPADRYTVTRFEQIGGKPQRRLVVSTSALYGRTAKQFDAPAGQTVKLAIGTPITAKVIVSAPKRSVTMQLALIDQAGLPMRMLTADRRRPAPPSFEILDAAGKKVYAGSFEYG